MDKLISRGQTRFLKDRFIGENIRLEYRTNIHTRTSYVRGNTGTSEHRVIQDSFSSQMIIS